jgi:hypothetical protein
MLSGYQLDDDLKPVIFWHTIDELTEEIASRLRKIERSRKESVEGLLTVTQVRRYSLSIGRRDEKVFISNTHSQNELAAALIARLREQAVRIFQYNGLDVPYL